MNYRREHVINQIRGTKKIIPAEVRRLAHMAWEEGIFNTEDYKEVIEFLDMNNGFATCRAWNTFLYRTCPAGALVK